MSYDFYFEREGILCEKLKRWGPTFMRLSLGVIFIWFGILKILGVSPIEELVRKTAFLINEHLFVVLLGYWELLIGICFIIKRLNRFAIGLFFLQIPGTFIPLFTNPADCFTFFPYGLTLEGQYIFKNFVLIAGALYVFSAIQDKR
ncbi:MAG: DoxX family membrane protein [Chlamydiae bacterium]|nr:DoxX family membrane protein [Chlamydiota bacterium]